MNKPQPKPPVQGDPSSSPSSKDREPGPAKPVSVNGVKIYERPKGQGLAGLHPLVLLILLLVLLVAAYLLYKFFVH